MDNLEKDFNDGKITLTDMMRAIQLVGKFREKNIPDDIIKAVCGRRELCSMKRLKHDL